MSVVSGTVPYQYIDIPFTFLGRFGGPSVGWSNNIQPIPEISGFLYEQAMYVHLAEIRKYGLYGDPTFYNYRAATPTEIAKQEILDPDPTGAFVSPSGNPYCLNYIVDLRASMNTIFDSVAWDTDSTQHVARTDYLRTSFSPLPSGVSGDFQYRVPEAVLYFGSIFGNNPVSASGVIGASGFLDTQTVTEISYQPYARFARLGGREVNGVTFETSPLFPALMKTNGGAYTQGPDEAKFDSTNYAALGLPQSSGYNPAAVVSGVMRVCGDGFSPLTQLRIISEENDPLTNNHVTDRWIGTLVYRNVQEAGPGNRPSTAGMALMDFTAQSPELHHGVHRIIVSDTSAGYGPSGVLSTYPNDEEQYHVTGWQSGIIAMNDNGTYSIVRNDSLGEPSDGFSLGNHGYQVVPVRSKGIHICNELFGGRTSSGILNISPFNGTPLMINAVKNENIGGTGEQAYAHFTKQPPPGITYVWRQGYDHPELYWRDGGLLVQAEGSATAYSFVRTQWSFRSYSSQQLPPPPDPTMAGSIRGTLGLGQNTHYYFHKVSLDSRSAEMSLVQFEHIGAGSSYAITGFAWSRNYGWFGTGGNSRNNNAFQAFTIAGSPDGGTFYESVAGGIEIVGPIGIGSKAFARRVLDIAGGVFSFWELKLGSSHGFFPALLYQYFVSVDTNLIPFTSTDINNFVSHTIFVGSNNEGITPGDWVVVALNSGQRFLCRLELDTSALKIKIVECLYRAPQTTATPEVFMNV